MNHWLERRAAKRKFDIILSMDGRPKQVAKLTEVRINLRDSINAVEIEIDTDIQSAEELGKFYNILADIFIDLSSFTEPERANITVVPNDATKDGYILTDAIALATNLHEVVGGTGVSVDISFSYLDKKAITYLSI